MAAVCAAAILALTGSFAAAPQASAAEYAAKKSRVSVHDPSVIKDGSTYYVFGSHIDAAKSTDLQNWRTFTNGYATTNNVEFGALSQNLSKAFAWAGEDLGDCTGGFAVWAPDVIWNPDYVNANGTKGAYVMYFCTSSDYRTSVIAYAVSQNIEGPYTFVDTLIYSGFSETSVKWGNERKTVDRRYTNTNIQQLIDGGEVTFNSQWFNNHLFNNQLFPNAIDPTIYTDTDGKMYMCYGSWSGGIFTLEIDKATGKCIHPKTGKTADGRMIDSYFGTKISGGYGKSGEGPFIEYNADTGYYYLWVTYGGLFSDGGYNMRVGRSKSPTGPFTDAAGRNMVLESNTDLNSIGLKVMTNYKFSSLDRAYMACGHNSVLKDDDGKWYLFNHARFDDGSEYHEVRVHAMNFNEAGWPVVMPYEYSGEEWSEAGYEESALTGTYEFINHGNGTDGKITTASKITLNADHSISGAVSGTWSEDGSSAKAEFNIGNVKYTGFFAAQHDESGTGRVVMTFTGAGNNNQTIWGVQTDAWNGKERSNLYNHFGSAQLCYDKNAVADNSGNVYIGDTKLLSNVPYWITNVNSGLLLETDPESGAVQQWGSRGNKSGNANQDFRITDLGNGYCRLTSMQDESKCIAVSAATAENGTELALVKWDGADTQQWKLIKSGDYYGIVSKCSGDSAGLDVYEWSKENGGSVKQWEYWGGECQLWKITPTHGMANVKSITMRNVNSGLYGGAANGSLVQTADETAWIVRRSDVDEGVFITDANGNAVTVADKSDGAALTLEAYTGADNQKFRIWGNADGSYSIHSVLTDEASAFDVYEISTEAGAKIVQWNFWGGTGQEFVLAPAAVPKPDPVVTTTTTALITTTTTETTTTATETEPVKGKLMLGDVDCSGDIDVSDTVLLARMLSEDGDAIVTAQGRKNADCDQDGIPTMDDATLILQHIAKLKLLPEIEE